MLLGFVEYALVGVGLASLIGKSRGRAAGSRIGVLALLVYIGAQVAAHLLLNLQPVNVRLLAHASREVSNAAVDRIRESGDADAVPALQQKLVEDFERGKDLEAGLLDALTALGGARVWQELLDSGRVGVNDRGAVAWRFIIENVRAMANPLFAEPRGGVRSPDFREEDIARLFDSVALKLTERLQAAPDAEASLTLLAVMKERPDLCRRYFQFVPIGLRGGPSTQAAMDLVGSLALKKAGRAADGKYDYQAMIARNESARYVKEHDAVAEEWIAWAKSATPCQ